MEISQNYLCDEWIYSSCIPNHVHNRVFWPTITTYKLQRRIYFLCLQVSYITVSSFHPDKFCKTFSGFEPATSQKRCYWSIFYHATQPSKMKWKYMHLFAYSAVISNHETTNKLLESGVMNAQRSQTVRLGAAGDVVGLLWYEPIPYLSVFVCRILSQWNPSEFPRIFWPLNRSRLQTAPYSYWKTIRPVLLYLYP